jgi:predicted deacetylase
MSVSTFSPELKNVIALLSRFQALTRSTILKNPNFLNTWNLSKEEKKLVYDAFNKNTKPSLRPKNESWG